MSTLAASLFSRYSHSVEEERSAMILSTLQTEGISNLMCNIAESKIRLEVSPDNYSEYVQQEAFLKGQLEILQHLLDLSEETQRIILEEIQAQRDQDA